MNISITGVLDRAAEQLRETGDPTGLSYTLARLCKHLLEMRNRVANGDLAAVDDFCRLYIEEGAWEWTPISPIPVVLFCPVCGLQHIDAPEPTNGWANPPHRSHVCQRCGHVWRPADIATTGVGEIGTRGSKDSAPVRGHAHG